MGTKNQETDNPFVEGSLMAQAFARVSDALVNRLAAKFEHFPPKDEFQKYLRNTVIYYEIGMFGGDNPDKKASRRQFETLQKASVRFVSALRNLHENYLLELQSDLEEPELYSRD